MNLRAGMLVVAFVFACPVFAQVTDCTGQPNGTVCNDGSTCTTGEVCKFGVCVGTAVVNGTSCNDGNSCTAGDVCTGGGCAGMLVDNGLRVNRSAPFSTTAVITWNLPSGATGSDIVRGRLSGLPVSPSGAGETPVVQNLLGSTSQSDATVPAPGTGFWYLARGTNACGKGPWGFETGNAVATVREISNGGCVPAANPVPRYLDNGSTITDLKTCLEWEKKTAAVGPNYVNDTYSWSTSANNPNGTAFTTFVPALNDGRFARHRDWRLPTEAGCCGFPTGQAAELESIIDLSKFPTIDPIFAPTVAAPYWSSSPSSASASYAWYVDFNAGVVYIDTETLFHPVRAVRGGP
jgi:hypothetical protein